MTISLSGYNWRNSNPHLLLLSKFLHSSSVDEFIKADYWANALSEDSKVAINRFINEGMLSQASLFNQIDHKFTSAELKNRLKQLGLPVSGKKDDLIDRLIQSDSEGIKNAVQGLVLYICSEQGEILAKKYLSDELDKQTKLENQVWEYLKQRNFKEASLSVSIYESKKVFPRGIGVDWKNHSPTPDVEALAAIFSYTPPKFSQMNDDLLEVIHLAAGMDYLWGENKAKWLSTESKFEEVDKGVAVRMCLSNGYFHRNISEYRKGGVVRQIQILADRCCENCMKLSGKKISLDLSPELPQENCTRKDGCNCVLTPVVG